MHYKCLNLTHQLRTVICTIKREKEKRIKLILMLYIKEYPAYTGTDAKPLLIYL